MATIALPNLRNLVVCEDIRRTYSDFTRDRKQGQDRCPRTSPLVFQVVKTETTKKTEIERLVKPTERMAPRGTAGGQPVVKGAEEWRDWPAPSTAGNKSCRKEPIPAATRPQDIPERRRGYRRDSNRISQLPASLRRAHSARSNI